MQTDIHSGDYGSFDSDCRQTMVGFVQSIPGGGGSPGTLNSHKVQCFHGTQDRYMDIEGTETMGNANTFKYAKITRHSAAAPIEVSKLDGEKTQKLNQNEGGEAEPHPDS